jgi:hypothetical protein
MMRPPNRQLLEALSCYDSAVADLALALREVVLEDAPDAVERMYQNHPSAVWFGVGPKMKDTFCYIAADFTLTRREEFLFQFDKTIESKNVT